MGYFNLVSTTNGTRSAVEFGAGVVLVSDAVRLARKAFRDQSDALADVKSGESPIVSAVIVDSRDNASSEPVVARELHQQPSPGFLARVFGGASPSVTKSRPATPQPPKVEAAAAAADSSATALDQPSATLTTKSQDRIKKDILVRAAVRGSLGIVLVADSVARTLKGK